MRIVEVGLLDEGLEASDVAFALIHMSAEESRAFACHLYDESVIVALIKDGIATYVNTARAESP